MALSPVLGASEELRSSLGLTEDEGDYRMLRPQESSKFLQKVFSKERHQNASKPNKAFEVKEVDHVPKEVDQVR